MKVDRTKEELFVDKINARYEGHFYSEGLKFRVSSTYTYNGLCMFAEKNDMRVVEIWHV